MAEPQRAFEIVDEPEKPAPQQTSAATDVLLLSLKTLSQRALTAIADLFTLLTVGSAFWLWYSVHDPNVYQIINNTIYGIFVLAANWIVRRR